MGLLRNVHMVRLHIVDFCTLLDLYNLGFETEVLVVVKGILVEVKRIFYLGVA